MTREKRVLRVCSCFCGAAVDTGRMSLRGQCRRHSLLPPPSDRPAGCPRPQSAAVPMGVSLRRTSHHRNGRTSGRLLRQRGSGRPWSRPGQNAAAAAAARKSQPTLPLQSIPPQPPQSRCIYQSCATDARRVGEVSGPQPWQVMVGGRAADTRTERSAADQTIDPNGGAA